MKTFKQFIKESHLPTDDIKDLHQQSAESLQLAKHHHGEMMKARSERDFDKFGHHELLHHDAMHKYHSAQTSLALGRVDQNPRVQNHELTYGDAGYHAVNANNHIDNRDDKAYEYTKRDARDSQFRNALRAKRDFMK